MGTKVLRQPHLRPRKQLDSLIHNATYPRDMHLCIWNKRPIDVHRHPVISYAFRTRGPECPQYIRLRLSVRVKQIVVLDEDIVIPVIGNSAIVIVIPVSVSSKNVQPMLIPGFLPHAACTEPWRRHHRSHHTCNERPALPGHRPHATCITGQGGPAGWVEGIGCPDWEQAG